MRYPPVVRHGERQIVPAHSQRLGLRAATGPWPDRDRRQVERDYRCSQAVGDTVVEGLHRDRRCSNCQRGIARQIVDQGGDYALALKGNQGTLHDDVRRFLDDPATEKIVAPPTIDGDHGRIETRIASISSSIDWLQGDHRWPGLKAIGKVVRIREVGAKTTTETAYIFSVHQ